MPILPLFVLMAQGSISSEPAPVRVEVPILHRRPSKIAGLLNELNTGPDRLQVSIVPDDEASALALVGPKEGVEETRKRIVLFDVEARRVRLAVNAESPIDHAAWSAEVEGRNNVAWSGSDDETGLSLRLVPRVNADGTCTVFAESRIAGSPSLKVVFRLKPGETQAFGTTSIDRGLKDREPRFSVRYLGN